MSLWVYVSCVQVTLEVRSPGTRITTGGCDLPNMVAGNQTLVLWKSIWAISPATFYNLFKKKNQCSWRHTHFTFNQIQINSLFLLLVLLHFPLLSLGLQKCLKSILELWGVPPAITVKSLSPQGALEFIYNSWVPQHCVFLLWIMSLLPSSLAHIKKTPSLSLGICLSNYVIYENI